MTTAQIAAFLNGQTLDLAFLRDGDPTEGSSHHCVVKEKYVAVLPEAHPLARRRCLSVKALQRRAVHYVCSTDGAACLRSDHCLLRTERVSAKHRSGCAAVAYASAVVVRGAWCTLAPACVARVAMPGAVYREMNAACRTSIDLGC